MFFVADNGSVRGIAVDNVTQIIIGPFADTMVQSLSLLTSHHAEWNFLSNIIHTRLQI